MARWLFFALAGGAFAFLLHRRRRSLGRRLRLALWVGLVLYAALYVARLIARPPDSEELLSLAGIVAGFGVLWAAFWLVTRLRSQAASDKR